jgi:hypothetical protein
MLFDILNIWFTSLWICISLVLFRRNLKMHGPSCKKKICSLLINHKSLHRMWTFRFLNYISSNYGKEHNMTGVKVVIQSVLQCPLFQTNCCRQQGLSLPIFISSNSVSQCRHCAKSYKITAVRLYNVVVYYTKYKLNITLQYKTSIFVTQCYSFGFN